MKKKTHVAEADVWARVDCEYDLRKIFGRDYQACLEALRSCMYDGGVVGRVLRAVDENGLRLVHDPIVCVWLIRLAVEAGYMEASLLDRPGKHRKRERRVLLACRQNLYPRWDAMEKAANLTCAV